MVKILSKSGDSLADIYDVQGSIAGIDQLDTRELPIFHEMGATVFSERFSTFTRSAATGDLLQSVDFSIELTDLPTTPTRLLGVVVFTDSAARVRDCAVHLTDPGNSRDFPVWIWDATNSILTRMNDGTGLTNFEVLTAEPGSVYVPNFTGGFLQPQGVRQIFMKGRTDAFGAGTVKIRYMAHIAFSDVGGLSSRGLPIPSW